MTLNLTLKDDVLTLETIRKFLQTNALEGFLIYFALFFVGNLAQIPGIIFLVAAVWAFGPLMAFFYTYAVAILACCSVYIVIRYLFRLKQEGDTSRFEKFKKYEEKFNDRPILFNSVLRFIFQTAPLLNLFLSYKTKSFRHYFLGLLFGMPIPLSFYILFIHKVPGRVW